MESNPFGHSDAFNDPSVHAAQHSAVPQQPSQQSQGSFAGRYDNEYTNPFTAPLTGEGNFGGGAYAGPHDSNTFNRPLLSSGGTGTTGMAGSSGGDISGRGGGGGSGKFPGEQDAAEREAAIKRREAAILQRERQLEDRETQLRGAIKNRNNWPFPFYAFTYHSISDEIPQHHQSLCRQFYGCVLVTWLALLWNWLVILILWGTDGDYAYSALIASVYLLLGVPGSWRLWYRSVYHSLRTAASTKWVFFFINFLAHSGFTLVMALGIPDCAAAGLFEMIKLFGNDNSWGGLFCVSSMLLWTFLFLASLYLLRVAHNVWKTGGGEARLRSEVAREAVSHSVEAGLNS